MPQTRTAPAETEAEKNETYIVVQSAVTIRTGRKPDQVTTLRHRALIEGKPSDERIRFLLSAKAIEPYVEGQAYAKALARDVVKRFGAEDDPALAPVVSALPLPAPATPGFEPNGQVVTE